MTEISDLVQLTDRLENTSQATTSFKMADIGLDGTTRKY